MNAKRQELLIGAVERGKYAPLYRYLKSLRVNRWSTTFAEVERILGFELPNSAHIHRPWWANAGSKGGHSQSYAWNLAGWKTTDVDQETQTVTFVRQ